MEAVRQCYICMDDSDGADTGGWVSPCLCSGSLGWVHKTCILRWIRESESTACAQCLTPFVLTPEKGPVVKFLEVLDRVVYPCCTLVAGSVMALIATETTCTAMGIISLSQVYGVEETQTMLMKSNVTDSVTHLHLISYSLVFVSYLPWDDYLLAALRRASRLPPLGRVLPSDSPIRYSVPPRSVYSILVGGVMLPTYAKMVGELVFRNVESKLNRVLLGGVVFLAVRCGLSMYYKQKLMMRRTNMRVVPFEINSSPS